ncbi:SRPBCC family protein [Nocardioides sp.]|uniref:SRPBCC family protein n=1 Tax=Nocardioides sp. TaxID=35761 RepID=UPI0035194DA5
MPVVRRTLEVATPPALVWRFLADYTSAEEWHPPVVSAIRISGDGGVGTTYHHVARFDGQETEIDYVVTDAVEQRLLVLQAATSAVTWCDTLHLAAAPHGGTRIGFQMEVAPRDGMPLAPVFHAPELEALADLVAESLRDSLENLHQPS